VRNYIAARERVAELQFMVECSQLYDLLRLLYVI